MYCKIEEPSVLCIVEYEQSKGQLISKGPFGILNSSKKRTKKINPTTYYDTSGLIVPLRYTCEDNTELVNRNGLPS